MRRHTPNAVILVSIVGLIPTACGVWGVRVASPKDPQAAIHDALRVGNSEFARP